MHHKYQAEAIILGSVNISENDKLIQLFTKEFGRIDAVAKGASNMKSKLRMNLVDYSLIDCFVIEGKNSFKIASVLTKKYYLDKDKNKNVFYIKIINLIKKFFQGRGDHELLFNKICSVFDLVRVGNYTALQIKSLAIFLTMLVLSELGYFELPDNINFNTEINEEFFSQINSQRKLLESRLKEILISTQV